MVAEHHIFEQENQYYLSHVHDMKVYNIPKKLFEFLQNADNQLVINGGGVRNT